MRTHYPCLCPFLKISQTNCPIGSRILQETWDPAISVSDKRHWRVYQSFLLSFNFCSAFSWLCLCHSWEWAMLNFPKLVCHNLTAENFSSLLPPLLTAVAVFHGRGSCFIAFANEKINWWILWMNLQCADTYCGTVYKPKFRRDNSPVE